MEDMKSSIDLLKITDTVQKSTADKHTSTHANIPNLYKETDQLDDRNPYDLVMFEQNKKLIAVIISITISRQDQFLLKNEP